MFNKLIQFIIGKNLPSFARAISTWIGSALLISAVYNPAAAPIDPDLVDAAMQIPAVSEAEIKDGVTMGELFKVLGGFGLILCSRIMSMLRGKNLTWLAQIFGAVIGRSMSSFIRALATGTSAILAFFTASPQLAPEVISEMPLATLIGSILAFVLARYSSATQDAKLNPISDTSGSRLFSNRDLDMTSGGFAIALCLLPLALLSSSCSSVGILGDMLKDQNSAQTSRAETLFSPAPFAPLPPESPGEIVFYGDPDFYGDK